MAGRAGVTVVVVQSSVSSVHWASLLIVFLRLYTYCGRKYKQKQQAHRDVGMRWCRFCMELRSNRI